MSDTDGGSPKATTQRRHTTVIHLEAALTGKRILYILAELAIGGHRMCQDMEPLSWSLRQVTPSKESPYLFILHIINYYDDQVVKKHGSPT